MISAGKGRFRIWVEEKKTDDGIILMVFGAVMMVKSYELAVFKWGSEIPLIHVPEGLRAIPIMLCGAFTFLYSIGHLIHFVKGVPEPKDNTFE